MIIHKYYPEKELPFLLVFKLFTFSPTTSTSVPMPLPHGGEHLSISSPLHPHHGGKHLATSVPMPPPHGGECLSSSSPVHPPHGGERLVFNSIPTPPTFGRECLILPSSNPIPQSRGEDHQSSQPQSKCRKVGTLQESRNQLNMASPIASPLQPIAPAMPVGVILPRESPELTSMRHSIQRSITTPAALPAQPPFIAPAGISAATLPRPQVSRPIRRPRHSIQQSISTHAALPAQPPLIAPAAILVASPSIRLANSLVQSQTMGFLGTIL